MKNGKFMIKFNIELEDKYHDEFMKILTLTQPEKGHTLLSIGKSINAYFSKSCKVEMKYIDTNGRNLFSARESYIQNDNGDKITFDDLTKKLINDNYISLESISIPLKTGNFNKNFYKVIDKFKNIN